MHPWLVSLFACAVNPPRDAEQTYQARSLKDSVQSGFTRRVLEETTERLRPPKSETRAPRMATTGCREPSNLSACKARKEQRLSGQEGLSWGAQARKEGRP